MRLTVPDHHRFRTLAEFERMDELRRTREALAMLPGLAPLGPFIMFDPPGSTTITATGTQFFIVPAYATSLQIELLGAGGGGGGTTGSGGTGGTTSIASLSLYAYGGGGGSSDSGSPGAPGSASGGTTNTTGGGANGGGPWSWDGSSGSAGGKGGFCLRSYAVGALTPGSTLTIIIGVGGSGGPGSGGPFNGGSGTSGRAIFTWT